MARAAAHSTRQVRTFQACTVKVEDEEKKKERVITLEQFFQLEGVSSLTPKYVLGKVRRRMARRWHASHYSRPNINKGLLCISLTRRRDEMVESNFSHSISISLFGFSSLLVAYADRCPN